MRATSGSSSSAAVCTPKCQTLVRPLLALTGQREHSQFFNFAMFWSSRVLRRMGGLHIHKFSTLQCFGAGSRRLPPNRVLRRLHGCRGPNLHTAAAVTDRGAQVGGTSRGRKSVAQVGGGCSCELPHGRVFSANAGCRPHDPGDSPVGLWAAPLGPIIIIVWA